MLCTQFKNKIKGMTIPEIDSIKSSVSHFEWSTYYLPMRNVLQKEVDAIALRKKEESEKYKKKK